MDEIKKQGLERVLLRHKDENTIEKNYMIYPVYVPCSLNKRKRWRKKMLPG